MAEEHVADTGQREHERVGQVGEQPDVVGPQLGCRPAVDRRCALGERAPAGQRDEVPIGIAAHETEPVAEGEEAVEHLGWLWACGEVAVTTTRSAERTSGSASTASSVGSTPWVSLRTARRSGMAPVCGDDLRRLPLPGLARPPAAYARRMGTVYPGIDSTLALWLERQPLYVVATAPLGADGLINASPKGGVGTFRVLDEHRVAYLDLTGSGVETIAHLRENGRIIVMFMAFEGRPTIVRLHGRGTAVLPGDAEFDSLVTGFTAHPGVRSVIVVDVERVADSCGYAVPLMDHVSDREVLDLANAKKGEARLADYRAERNAVSLDGLPGLPAGVTNES